MDLALGIAAGAQMWLRPKRGKKKKKAHNVFLVRDSQAGPRVLLLVPHYNIEMQLDSGQARPRRWPERAAADSHGRRWAAPAARAPRRMRGGARWAAARGPRCDPGSPRGPDPATRAPGRRRLGDASPAPASSRAARDCFARPYLSLKLIFFFNLVTGTKATGKSFVKAKRAHKSGHFTAFVTKYLPCW